MSSRIRLHRQRGFTLAEILVTTAIFAIIMIAALAVYDQSNRVFKSSTESADLQQSTRIGFDKLVADLRMAGFDYSRGGTPQESWQAPQPDEQIEYAGPTAVVFRANFNYNSATTQGNGLEPAYTPVNVNGGKIFPYVTTSNDEIVAYVLRSANPGVNTGSIALYVDDYQPRSAFPNTLTPAPSGSNPSHPERAVTISGIDTTNNNPPYTLYRVTVTDVHNGSLGTPVAENIRSLKFQYYTDLNGTALLTNADGTAIVTGRDAGGGTFAAGNTGAIGGDGLYDPNNVGAAPNFVDRTQRARIASIRVSLVGMNASPDLSGYTNPTETIASIKGYRQYALSSLVAPRNLGLTGFPEPSYNPPAPPTITGMCVGYCGAPVIYWQPPAGGGPVVSYMIAWDTNQQGAFAAPHQLTVNDPTATSAVLPDDGVSDVSQTWWYKVSAMNDNGAGTSAPSQAVPRNAVKPSPVPTGSFVASDPSLGNAQANQITLQWTAPSTNDPTANTLSCTGFGGSTDGSVIPLQAPLHYRIWRGTTPTFDTSNGIVVLGFYAPSQPPVASPGSQVTWIDSVANSAMPPANCVQYYYRIQAAYRCQKQGIWNVNSLQSTSVSTFYPAIGSNAIPGQATSPNTPATPTALTVDTTNSGCPDPQNPPSPNCRIILNWPKVMTDTAGNAIGVDIYRITRSVKHQNNIPSNGYVLDATFGTGGRMDVPGFSQMSGGTATWTDTTAIVADPTPPFQGSAYSYEYTVAAKQCGNYSAESNTADYPAACTINPTIIQGGASNPLASGDTPAQAWIFNAGDTITVNPPSGGPSLSRVNFIVTTYPQGLPVDNQTVLAPGPFVYTWSDRVDLQIYQVTIVVTNSQNCQETHIKYVQDQATAPCAFPSQTPPAPSLSTQGQTVTASTSFTVTNNGTDPINFNVVSPAFQGNITVTWADPGGHPDLTAVAVVWQTGAFSTTDNFSLTTSPYTRSVPSNMPSVAPGATFTVTVRFTYARSEPALTNPIQKICISYRIPSEPRSTKFCNLVGQLVTTNNPTGCD